MNEGLLFALVAAVFALLYGIVSIKWILGLPTGNDRMREIAAAVQEGASAYLNRQYTTIGIVVVILLIAIFVSLGWQTAVGFALGAFLSGLTGYIGMNVSVRANVPRWCSPGSGRGSAGDRGRGGAPGAEPIPVVLRGIDGLAVIEGVSRWCGPWRMPAVAGPRDGPPAPARGVSA